MLLAFILLGLTSELHRCILFHNSSIPSLEFFLSQLLLLYFGACLVSFPKFIIICNSGQAFSALLLIFL